MFCLNFQVYHISQGVQRTHLPLKGRMCGYTAEYREFPHPLSLGRKTHNHYLYLTAG